MDANAQHGQPLAVATRTPRARRLISQILVTVAPLVAAYALLLVFETLTTSFRGRHLDFAPYYAAAAALAANPHANIYDQSVLARAAVTHPGVGLWPGAAYLYPPLLAILFVPLTALPYDTAFHVWMLLNLLLWAGCAGLLGYWLHVLWSRDEGYRRPVSSSASAPARQRFASALRGELDSRVLAILACVVLALAAWPVLEGLLMGQVHLLVFFALLCVPLLVRRDHALSAGLLLALVTAIKLLPAVLILYFVARGRWRVALSSLAWLALIIALMALVVGVPVLLDARHTLGGVSSRESWNGNQSIAAAPALLASAFGRQMGANSGSAGRVITALALAAFGIGLVWIWRARGARKWTVRTSGPDDAATELLEYGWALCGMVGVAPLVWIHYNTWLLFPVIVCLGYWLRMTSQPGVFPRWLPTLLAATYVLIFLPWSFAIDSMAPQSGPHVLGVGVVPLLLLLHPLSVAALWSVAGWMVWHCHSAMPKRAADPIDAAPHDPLGEAQAH